jgi:hypothetical protein
MCGDYFLITSDEIPKSSSFKKQVEQNIQNIVANDLF